MESDENLALSLLEQIFDEFYIDSEFNDFKKDLKTAGNTLLHLAKNIALNTTIHLPGISMDVGKAGQETKNQMDKIINGESHYRQIKKFKDSFEEFINEIIEKTKYKKIYVFVDDLDRCESENIINLISNIKLFFTLSKKLIFLCAIDKSAVSNALKIKYGNVIKAEEYLEKVFDISFNMPIDLNMNKLIANHFSFNNKNTEYLISFFKAIKFNNPRKIIRLINKYEVIKLTLIMEQDKSLRNDDLLFTVFSLYFLILNEFFNDKFKEFISIEKRLNNFKRVNGLINEPHVVNSKQVANHYFDKDSHSVLVVDYLDSLCNQKTFPVSENFLIDKDMLHSFIVYFTPLFDKEAKIVKSTRDKQAYKNYINQFTDEENFIITSFVCFILDLATFSKDEILVKRSGEFDITSLIELIQKVS